MQTPLPYWTKWTLFTSAALWISVLCFYFFIVAWMVLHFYKQVTLKTWAEGRWIPSFPPPTQVCPCQPVWLCSATASAGPSHITTGGGVAAVATVPSLPASSVASPHPTGQLLLSPPQKMIAEILWDSIITSWYFHLKNYVSVNLGDMLTIPPIYTWHHSLHFWSKRGHQCQN